MSKIEKSDVLNGWIEDYEDDIIYNYKEKMLLGIDEDDLSKMIWLDNITITEIRRIDEDWLLDEFECYLENAESDRGL